MKKTAILVILPEFKTELDVLKWQENVKWAFEKYDQEPAYENYDVSIEQRWAIGYVIWRKLVEYLNIEDIVKVYFMRTDYRLTENYTIEDDVISIPFDNHCGHIIHKTLVTLEIIKNKFDYIVRANCNAIIDLYQLSKIVQDLPTDGVFTSPFWEGGSYPFGYFFLISNDISNFLIDSEKPQRWFLENTADDYELTKVILTKYNYYVLPGCDEPWISTSHPKPPISNLNKHGIKFDGGQTGEQSSFIIEELKKSEKSIFVHRIKKIADNKYISVYKFLIKHIWNKIVEERFNLTIQNENGGIVPHWSYERDEQLMVAKYLDENDVVLELGARYGSVSCIINKIIKNKSNQVSVEPDPVVWEVLEKNMKLNDCDFHIYKGIISSKNYDLKINGYGSTVDITNTITTMKSVETENISLDDLQNNLGLIFNVLVADCEGFLETFLNENPILYSQLDKIIFECDRGDVCDYNFIKSQLVANGFKPKEVGFQSVYVK
jgi:FkbM family methyltransferase